MQRVADSAKLFGRGPPKKIWFMVTFFRLGLYDEIVSQVYLKIKMRTFCLFASFSRISVMSLMHFHDEPFLPFLCLNLDH